MKKTDPLAVLQAAATAHEAKNHEAAIKLYQAVLALDPNQFGGQRCLFGHFDAS